MAHEYVMIKADGDCLSSIQPETTGLSRVKRNSKETMYLSDVMNVLGESNWELVPGIVLENFGKKLLFMRREKELGR